MTKKEIEYLKERLETAKQKKAEAQGALSSLETTMREKYRLEGDDVLDAAEALLEELQADKVKQEKKLAKKEEELEKVIPEEWRDE